MSRTRCVRALRTERALGTVCRKCLENVVALGNLCQSRKGNSGNRGSLHVGVVGEDDREVIVVERSGCVEYGMILSFLIYSTFNAGDLGRLLSPYCHADGIHKYRHCPVLIGPSRIVEMNSTSHWWYCGIVLSAFEPDHEAGRYAISAGGCF